MAYSTKSVLFNGTTQYGTAGDVLGFEYNQPFSVSCWFKSTFEARYFVSKREDATTYRGWGFAFEGGGGGALVFFLTSNGAAAEIIVSTDTTGFADGQWHHGVATYNGNGLASGVTIYVDGSSMPVTADSDNLSSGTIITTASFNVGSRTDGVQPFDGNLDEVAVYDKELSAAEVSWIYNAGNTRDLLDAAAPSNIVWWCRMGENGTATVLADETGPTGYSPLTTSIEVNNGTTDEVIQFPPITAYDYDYSNTGFSFGCWFKHTSTTTQTIMCLSRSSTGSYFWAVQYRSSRLLVQRGITGGNYSYFNIDTADGQWHHLVVRFTGSTIETIYVDGAQVWYGTSGSPPTMGTDIDDGITVGGHITWTGVTDPVVDMRICHCFLYNKTLDWTDIQNIYNNGIPPDLSSVGPTTDLILWSPLGDGDTIGSGNLNDLSINANNGTYVNGDSGDFVSDVPLGGLPLTLIGSPTIADDAPPGTEFGGAYEPPPTSWDVDPPPYTPDGEVDVSFEPAGRVKNYLMRGVNISSNYVHWTVQGEPDVTGAFAPETIPDPTTITIAGRWIT